MSLLADARTGYLHSDMNRQAAEALLTKYGNHDGLFLVRAKTPGSLVLSLAWKHRFIHYMIGVATPTSPTYTFDGTTNIFGDAHSLDAMIQAMRTPRPNWATPLEMPVTVAVAKTGRDQKGLIKWNLQGESRLHDTYIEVLTPYALDRKRWHTPARESRHHPHHKLDHHSEHQNRVVPPQRSASLSKPSRGAGGLGAIDHVRAMRQHQRQTPRGDHLRQQQPEDDLYDFTRAEAAPGGMMTLGPTAPRQTPHGAYRAQSGGGGGISRARRGTAGASFVHKDMHKAKAEFEAAQARRPASVSASVSASASATTATTGRPSAVDRMAALSRHRTTGSAKQQSRGRGAGPAAAGDMLYDTTRSVPPTSTSQARSDSGGGRTTDRDANRRGANGDNVFSTPQRGLVPFGPSGSPSEATASALPVRWQSHGSKPGRTIKPNYVEHVPDDGAISARPQSRSTRTNEPMYMGEAVMALGMGEPTYMDKPVSAQAASPPVPMSSHPSVAGPLSVLDGEGADGVAPLPGPANAAAGDGKGKGKGIKKNRPRSKIGGLFASIKGKKKKSPRRAAGPKLLEKTFSNVVYLGSVPVSDSTGADTCAAAVERVRYNIAAGGGASTEAELALFPTHVSVADRKNVELQYVPIRGVTYGYTDCECDEAVFGFIFEATPGNHECMVMEAMGSTGSTLMKRMELSMTAANINIEYDGPDTMKTNC